ncbi:MAG: AAA family ATPase [Leptospiraceae bacterium]|nr:AAA family ATPase [Leptospiraceae bacterium]MCP5499066.1 AAA family ATPase [Leptospiraceae bacterium]
MLTIAYGEANFDNLRRNQRLFLDKTHFIPRLEAVEKFFFIRPRRFGKSLWISVLQSYYDIKKQEKFDELFHELYIHKQPTRGKRSICS